MAPAVLWLAAVTQLDLPQLLVRLVMALAAVLHTGLVALAVSVWLDGTAPLVHLLVLGHVAVTASVRTAWQATALAAVILDTLGLTALSVSVTL